MNDLMALVQRLQHFENRMKEYFDVPKKSVLKGNYDVPRPVEIEEQPISNLQAEIVRLKNIINQQAELIRKYEIDVRQLEHLLSEYKKMVDGQ